MSRLPLHPDIHALARRRAHELRNQAIGDMLQRLVRLLRRPHHPAPEAAPCHS